MLHDCSLLCARVCAKSPHSRLTLCDLMDHSPPGSSICGNLQARILEWVAVPPPGDPPNAGIKLMPLTSPAAAGEFFFFFFNINLFILIGG